MRPSAAFEEEVRRVARELFPQGKAYGPVIVDGRERDSVINTGEVIHIIEATQLPTKAKAQTDLQKSIDLKRLLAAQYPDHNFHIWFVTHQDPTADQISEADSAKKRARCPVTAIGLAAFQQRLVNSAGYLAIRRNYSFGSVRNPDPNSPSTPVSESQFIALDLLNADTKAVLHPQTLAEDLQDNPRVTLILADFGAGKSMTMRHLYYDAERRYSLKKSLKFPIFLNLRDHVGQDDPSSALFDHGSKIGLSNPEQLVRAWRAGFAHIFLDGFDEITSSRFRRGSLGLRAVRRSAMTLVREFIDQHPIHNSSLLVSGRANYFGSSEELRAALGLGTRSYDTYTLSEFTIEQVQIYLNRLGLDKGSIPDWLPSRPLLVGYLATRGVLSGSGSLSAAMSRAEGWDFLLEQICEREGRQIQELGGQAGQVRTYVDRLATKSRSTTSGRGPLSTSEMTELFSQVFPLSPDEAAQQLLVRMAGLTSTPDDIDATPSLGNQDYREFVDDDLVDVARAGDVAKFVEYPYDEELNNLFLDRNCTTVMGELGVEVAALKLFGTSSGQLTNALQMAAESGSSALALDIFRVIQALGAALSPKDAKTTITISNGYISQLDLDKTIGAKCVTLRECMIGTINVDPELTLVEGPHLSSCIVEEVHGIRGLTTSSSHLFGKDNEIGDFKIDGIANAELRRQSIPDAVMVLVVCLRKLFLQPGGARKANAFPRGLNDTERAYVDDVLDLIFHHEFAYPQRSRGPEVWVANKAKRAEAISITQAPLQTGVPLLDDVRRL